MRVLFRLQYQYRYLPDSCISLSICLFAVSIHVQVHILTPGTKPDSCGLRLQFCTAGHVLVQCLQNHINTKLHKRSPLLIPDVSCLPTHTYTHRWENPLMGWTSTADTLENVGRASLFFYNKEQAIEFW